MPHQTCRDDENGMLILVERVNAPALVVGWSYLYSYMQLRVKIA